MENLNVVFDSLAGYLLGMTLVEVVVKPCLVKIGKSALRQVDESLNDVVPDFLHSDEE